MIKKNPQIILSIIFSFIFGFIALAATDDVVFTENVTVTDVTFGTSTVDMLIFASSTAQQVDIVDGVFSVTNPGDFFVGSADSSVEAIGILSSSTLLSCTLNSNPGVSSAQAPTDSGTYIIKPSNFTNCSDITSTSTSTSSATSTAITNLTADGSNPSPIKNTSDFLIDLVSSSSLNNLIKMNGLSTVYILDDDDKRHVFPNEQTYQSWYSDYNAVETVTQSELISYQLGSNIYIRPGTKLVKVTSSDTVYAVEPDGVLRPVGTEENATYLWGAFRNNRVIDIPDGFFAGYTIGSTLTAGQYPIGSLLNKDNHVYYYDGTNYREIVNEEAFMANRFSWSNVINVPSDMTITAGGNPITGAESMADPTQGLITNIRNFTYWYKLGSAPTANNDGTATTLKPFTVNATQTGGEVLYVWLEDDQGNVDYNNYASIELNYSPIQYSPIKLTANGSSPSPIQSSSDFLIDWVNPASGGELVKMEGLSTVYIIADNGKRHAFPNKDTFFSWFSNYSGVKTISQSELESHALGGNVLIRPGTKLVKKTSEDTVYAVEDGGVLRPVGTETNAEELWGANWRNRIVDVPDAFFTNYSIGSTLPEGQYSAGSLLKQLGKIYYFDGSDYREIANEAAFNVNRFKWEDVVISPSSIVASGEPITGIESFADPSQGGITDLRNFSHYWYKLGSAPTSATDGSVINYKPFALNATAAGGQTLYVWLEDESGFRDYTNYATVQLNYIVSAPLAPLEPDAQPQDGQVVIKWKGSNAQTFPISGYNIYQGLSHDSIGTTPINASLISPLSELTYTVDSLTNWTTYYFVIKAVDNQGNSGAESGVFFATPYPGPFYTINHYGPISTGNSATKPQIDNKEVVWEDARNSNPDIYHYDIISETESQITTNISGQYSPSISGNKVVWRDHRDSTDTEIYEYNLDTSVESDITSDSVDQDAPHNFGNKIVWRDLSSSSTPEIYLYNSEVTSTAQQISDGVIGATGPKIYDDRVVWSGDLYTADSATTDMFFYNITAGGQLTAFANLDGEFSTNIYDQDVIWSTQDDMYMYNTSDVDETRISFNSISRDQFDIHNNKVVWNGNNKIYLYDIATNNEYHIFGSLSSQYFSNLSSQYHPAVHNSDIVWQGNDVTGSNIFYTEVHTVPNAPTNLTADGTNPSPQKSTTSFAINWTNSFDPSGIAKYWYKLGSAPTANDDGVTTTTKPFNINATAESQTLYLWLENNDGYKDYNNNMNVELRYVATTSTSTSPAAPINLTANGANPSAVNNTPYFTIDWTNPSSSSTISKYWYTRIKPSSASEHQLIIRF